MHKDLVNLATSHSQLPLASAKQIGTFASSLSITIICLNGFKNFEGNLSVPLQVRLALDRKWVDLALALGTRVVQVPSSFLLEPASDDDIIVHELQALADLAAKHGVQITYENVAYARYYALWQAM